SSTKDKAGGRVCVPCPPHRPRERTLIAGGAGAINSRQTWRQRHGQASPAPFRLGDIAGAGPHGPNALLLIPLKLRDGAHAHSGLLLPLASILLAPKAEKPGHPVWGPVTKGKGKHYKTWAKLEERAGKLGRNGNPTTPIYSSAGHQASSLSKGGGLDRP